MILKLNKNFTPCGTCDWQDAISGLFKGVLSVFDIKLEEDGTTSGLGKLDWQQWIERPIDKDAHCEFVGTVDMMVQIPQIVICDNYDKVDTGDVVLTKERIWQRDNYTCVYTGRKLSKKELSVDHVVPISRGGSVSEWTNLVTTSKRINSYKSDWLLEEIPQCVVYQMGLDELKLRYKPYKPKSKFIYNDPTPEQSVFLK